MITETCESCGREFGCGARDGACWCKDHTLTKERLAVLKCSGVVNIVSFNGDIAPIPEREIDAIRQLVESDLQYDPCPLINEGMMVEVAHGPLKGVIGRLVRKGAHARLVLAVDLIGQAVSFEVDAADVKAY